MRAILPVLFIAALLSCFGASAQPQVKAYAPDNLSSLNRHDRVRVIEREYADQSNGRRIPDDQLEFYLDQVDSGWGFSRIKQDIAVSLRGSGGGWQPGHNGGWNPGHGGMPGGQILCESHRSRRANCATGTRNQVVLTQQLSSTQCIEGRNWGQSPGTVWVDGGCRARFAVAAGGGIRPPFGPGMQVRCESDRDRYKECPTPFRGSVVLVEQISRAGCTEGRDWGWRPGSVWVKDGCRAIFAEGHSGSPGYPGGGADYSVTCSSDDGRLRSCAWDTRYGYPRLIENISRTRCVEGSNWGYDTRQGLWVNQGCRARFGAY